MIEILWRPKLNNINHLKADNKTLLQEWSQSRKLGLPKYSTIKKTGPDHSPSFAVKVDITNYRSKTGVGKTVQDAQQDAADQFLKNIKN